MKELKKMETKLILSPLVGFTDDAFRRICDKNGVDYKYTEMVSAKALYYGDKKTKRLMHVNKDDKNTGIQIFGSEPEIMGKIVKEYINKNDDFSSIDINMGCPANKIVKNMEGAALMKDPLLASKVIREVVKSSNKPVSVKFRLGFDYNHINYLEIGKICEEEGASHVTLHARTREQMYMGEADWEHIKILKDSLSIPVYGNGDIFTPEDAYEKLIYSNVDGLQIARGAIGNPFIFRQIKEYMNKGTYEKVSYDELFSTIKEQYNFMIELKDDKVAITQMRKHIAYYIKGLKNSNRVKDKLNQINDIDEIFNLLDLYKEELLKES